MQKWWQVCTILSRVQAGDNDVTRLLPTNRSRAASKPNQRVRWQSHQQYRQFSRRRTIGERIKFNNRMEECTYKMTFINSAFSSRSTFMANSLHHMHLLIKRSGTRLNAVKLRAKSVSFSSGNRHWRWDYTRKWAYTRNITAHASAVPNPATVV